MTERPVIKFEANPDDTRFTEATPEQGAIIRETTNTLLDIMDGVDKRLWHGVITSFVVSLCMSSADPADCVCDVAENIMNGVKSVIDYAEGHA